MGDLFQNVRLASPGWLAAMLLVPLVAVALRGSLARESAARRIATVILRVSALSLLVLALCSPVVDTTNHTSWAVLLVDRSESISPEGMQAARNFVEEAFRRQEPNRVTIVPFASEPGEPAVGQWPDSATTDASGTDLVAAFLGALPSSRPFGPARVVLLSDGNETVGGDVRSAALALQAPVDTVPLPTRTDPDAWVEAIDAPSEVRPGDSVPLEVLVGANGNCQATVRVLCNGDEVAHDNVALTEGRLTVPFEVTLGTGSRDVYRVLVEAESDSRSANNWAEVAVWHGAKARALLVGRETSQFSRLARVLEAEQFQTKTITVDGFPRDAKQLSEFDLVVLADVPASEFSSWQLQHDFNDYVGGQAGGLIVFGGQDSLTAGDYWGTGLGTTLPVTCEYDVQAKRPSLAMVVAIDQSGSMQEGGAIGLAKTALRETVEMLDEQDQLGVIAFQDATQWIAPLQLCDDKEKVLREIDTLEAGGGTNMHPAIAKAHLALHEAYADLKHIIVLTDGISYPGDFDTLATEIAASGITISTVAVGSEAAEPLLQSIAELGGGNYHHCPSAAKVPEIFVRETAKAAKMGIREGPIVPKVDLALGSIVSLPATKPPTLLGYVQTKAKSLAQVGIATESGDPLVAWWRHARGRSAVFTSDLHGPWSRPWQNWPGLTPLWSGLAKHIVRSAYLDGYQIKCKRREGSTLVIFDAVRGFKNHADVLLEISAPDGSKQQQPMILVAPGQYAVSVPTPEPGIYDFQATCTIKEQSVFTGRCSACPAYPAELVPHPPNEPLLRELAAATGGRFNPDPGELLPPGELPSLETHGLWHYLLLAVVLLLLAELSLRRLASWKTSAS